MSNITGDLEGSFSSGNNTGGEEVHDQEKQQKQLQHHQFHGSNNSSGLTIPSLATTNSNDSSSHNQQQQQPAAKKKRNLPGTPDPHAEVIALSPTTLMATNRFVCEICNKGFQRDQNLQLHRRGHNLPWKLRQRATAEVKKRVYICPEPTCVHHNPARALGDLTGIKKHFSRKHGEKKWKCDKCSKKYAVQSDWKAHQKTCGTREYKCDCGTIFSRRDSFITHRAFCDALAEENNKPNQGLNNTNHNNTNNMGPPPPMPPHHDVIPSAAAAAAATSDFNSELISLPFKTTPNAVANLAPAGSGMLSTALFRGPTATAAAGLQLFSGSAHMSATALLQKAAQMGATASTDHRSFDGLGSSDHAGMVYGHRHSGRALLLKPSSAGELDHIIRANNNNINNNSGLMMMMSGLERSSPLGPSRLGGGDDKIVVDFMGINGESRGVSLLEHQRLLNSAAFQHQHLSHHHQDGFHN